MKTITYLASTLLLSSMAISAMAASPNGPKPENCPPNQIPVFKQGIGWVCDVPHLKSNTSPQAASARGGIKATTTIKPQRAKPDLSIANYQQLQGPTANIDKFKVYVKNTGPVKSAACNMSLSSSTNGGASISVPQINPGSGQWITVTFAKFPDNTVINLYVDSKKKVSESNEKNNTYRFAWK